MRRAYEIGCVFRLDPSDETMQENITQVQTWLEEDDHGKVTKLDRWGRRKLAYEIDRQREGYYIFFYADVDPAAMPEIEHEMKLAPFLLRFLVIRLEDAVEEAEELQEE